jgi:hypothetical protein
MVLYADRARFDRVRLQVTLIYARLDDPPTPLSFETDERGLLQAKIAPSCQTQMPACTAVYTTDFATEMSLWD